MTAVPEITRRVGWSLATLAVLFALVYLVPLGVRPLAAPDETRYAEIPREMIESGSWIVPHLDGLRYFEKPPFGYWVTAASILALGKSELAVRLPSALSAGLTAALILALVTVSSGRWRAGILTAAVYLTLLEVLAVGITNVLDSLLTLLLTAVMITFYWAQHEQRPRARTCLLAVTGVLAGLAFLTKGFLALVIPVLVAVPLLAIEARPQRRWSALLRAPWIPALTALLTVLPWSIMIQVREPDFWRYFVWVEHIARFLNPSDAAQHREPWWFFLPYLIGSSLLWLPLLPAVISGLRSRRPPAAVVRFALLWLVLPFLFFSASSGKLGTYILPCMPPLAVLAGLGLDGYLESKKHRETGRQTQTLLRLGLTVCSLGMLAAAAFLTLVQLTGNPVGPWYGPAEAWKWQLGAATLVVAAGLYLLAGHRAGARSAIWLACLAPALFLASVSFIVPEQSGYGKLPGEPLVKWSRWVPADAAVLTDQYLVHAVCWYLDRDDISIVGSGGELRYGLQYAGSSHRQMSPHDLRRYLSSEDRTETVVVIVRERSLTAWSKQLHLAEPLPAAALQASELGFLLLRYEPP